MKGQNFAPDTLEILLANAYHWNPCWKVDDMLHFWLLAFYFHKKTTVWLQILEFLGLTSAPDMFLFTSHSQKRTCAPPIGLRWYYILKRKLSILPKFIDIWIIFCVRTYWLNLLSNFKTSSMVHFWSKSWKLWWLHQRQWLRYRSPEGMASREISLWCK